MSSAANSTDSDSNLVQLLSKSAYPVWSPYDAYEAAEVLLQMLEKEKEKKLSVQPPASELVKKLRR